MNPLPRATDLVGLLLCVAMVVPFQAAVAQEAGPPLHQQIDELVARQLADRKIVPAATSSDAEFLRRVSLDLTGVVPTARQARAFLDDASPDKRQRLIESLLASPDYAIHMARVFDVMLIERRIPAISSYDVPAPAWRAYLTAAFAENRPWDQMVRDILAGDGSDETHAAAVKFYLVRDVAPHQLTRDVGRLFLGVDLQCAQCHDDPRFDAYRQADYFGIYAFLQRVTPFRDMQKNASLVGETAVGKATFVSVFTAKSGETHPRLPGGEMIADPAVEPGQEYVVKPGPKERGVPTYSRQKKLAELLPRPETQGFSRNIANRLWAMMMGRGIVHPLDLHHAGNPPSHPELLDRLERWLVEQKYDTKALLRELALSQVYQRSSLLPPEAPTVPDDAFAVAPLRGLTAEQLGWSLLQVSGRLEHHFEQAEAKRKSDAPKPDDLPPLWKSRLLQLEPLERQARTLITVFAGLPGQPEGDFQPVVDQSLHLLNSPSILPLLQDQPGTLLTKLLASAEVEPLADELYLSVLSRRSDADELAEIRQLLPASVSSGERRERLQSLIWGLMLSSEFRLNH